MRQSTSRKASNRQANRAGAPSKGFSGLQLFLLYIIPFIIVNSIIFFLVTAKPKYELVVAPTEDYHTTTATFTITSHLPLKNVTITFNEEPLDLVKVGKKSYQATITCNGILDVFMQNFNGMSVSNFEVIDILDDEAPGIASYDMQDGLLTITLTDSLSGIDYDNLYGMTTDGTVIQAISIDRASSTVVFPIDHNGLTLSIKDLSGNEYLPSFSIVTGSEDALSSDSQLLVQ